MATTFSCLPDNKNWQMGFSGADMIPLGAFLLGALRNPFELGRVSRQTGFRIQQSKLATLTPHPSSAVARLNPPIRRWNNPALMAVRISFDNVTRQLFLSERNQTQIEYEPLKLNESGKRAIAGQLTIRYRLPSDNQDSFAVMFCNW